MADVMRRVEKPDAPKRMPTISDSALDAALERALACARTGDWERAFPRDYVALYDHFHEAVYGIRAGELTPKARALAAALVSRVLEKDFNGDKKALGSFVIWTWTRERSKHKWRVDSGAEPFRVSWKYAFSPRMITDWRMATRGLP
jgi:hypothetical protein